MVIRLVLGTIALIGIVTGAAPADAANRSFSVTGFDRIRVDGPFRVRLTTGVAPFASATGSTQALDSVVIEVQGRTLVVHLNRSSWGGYPGQLAGPVEINVGTHELNAAWLNGAGSLAIDKVKGLSFDLSAQGAGAASIGSVAVDRLKVAVAGTGSLRVAGSAANLTAVIRGSSSLEAAELTVKDAVIGAEGPATVRATVTGTAKVDAMGVAQVELAGKPACTTRAQGAASVSGCR
jgi:hypothetical protein